MTSNTPIVWLHGFMGSHKDWLPITSQIDHNSICIDLPGHGSANHLRSNNGFEGVMTYVVNALEKRNITRCHIVGYSMGGRLAMMLVTRFPKLFNKVVIESAHPGIISSKERENRYQQDITLKAALESMCTSSMM